MPTPIGTPERRAEQERPQTLPTQRRAQFPHGISLNDQAERDDQGCGLQRRQNVKPDRRDQPEGEAGDSGDQSRRERGRCKIRYGIEIEAAHALSPVVQRATRQLCFNDGSIHEALSGRLLDPAGIRTRKFRKACACCTPPITQDLPRSNGDTRVHGRFAWYELATTDFAAAKAFYTKVMGWGIWDASGPGRPYILFTDREGSVAGLMILSPEAWEAGMRPSWLGHVAVDDVDATATRVKRLGGGVHVRPKNVGNVSRFAIFSDPQAARLGLFKWLQPGPPPAAVDAPGRVGWHELLAAHCEQAFAFYSALFGWRKAESERSEDRTYQPFSAAGEIIGGMMTKPDTLPASTWHYYFNVSDIDEAAKRVKAAGGEIVDGPIEVPGGSWIIHCTDPQGAIFALEGKRGRNPVGYFARTGSPAGARGRQWSW